MEASSLPQQEEERHRTWILRGTGPEGHRHENSHELQQTRARAIVFLFNLAQKKLCSVQEIADTYAKISASMHLDNGGYILDLFANETLKLLPRSADAAYEPLTDRKSGRLTPDGELSWASPELWERVDQLNHILRFLSQQKFSKGDERPSAYLVSEDGKDWAALKRRAEITSGLRSFAEKFTEIIQRVLPSNQAAIFGADAGGGPTSTSRSEKVRILDVRILVAEYKTFSDSERGQLLKDLQKCCMSGIEALEHGPVGRAWELDETDFQKSAAKKLSIRLPGGRGVEKELLWVDEREAFVGAGISV